MLIGRPYLMSDDYEVMTIWFRSLGSFEVILGGVCTRMRIIPQNTTLSEEKIRS